MTEETDPAKVYVDATVSRRMAARAASEIAAFLLPHLKPGMTVLDAGCGPGSITIGLAEAVAPGQVIGIDIEPAQVERAAAAATAQQISNVRFEVGNAYDLPVPDGSVDVVFAHALLVHLAEPVRALGEFRRVLKPSGVAAVREQDASTAFCEPSTPPMDVIVSLLVRYFNLHGNLSRGRRLRALMAAAGFTRTEGLALAQSWGSSETLPALVNVVESMLCSLAFQQAALKYGWADAASLETLLVACRTWAQRPDAFCAQMTFAALGWVDGQDGDTR